jgi:hypothetical protein
VGCGADEIAEHKRVVSGIVEKGKQRDSPMIIGRGRTLNARRFLQSGNGHAVRDAALREMME